MTYSEMKKNIITTGNSGPKVRSDCEITLELKSRGGVIIDLSSKVKPLYGESIINLCNEILEFFGIKNASLNINDTGAVSFVIAARLEAAIKQLIDTEMEFLPEMIKENDYSS